MYNIIFSQEYRHLLGFKWYPKHICDVKRLNLTISSSLKKKKEKRKKKEKEKKDRKQKLLIRFSLMPNITNQSNTLIFLIIWYLGGRI